MDAYGRATIARVSHAKSKEEISSEMSEELLYTIGPSHLGESGWAGMTSDKTEPGPAALAEG